MKLRDKKIEPMLVIGFSGKMGHGKDEARRIARRICYRYHTARVAFGDILKREVAAATQLDVEFINANKEQFRELLQCWGTQFRRKLFGENYWVRQMKREMDRLRNDDGGYLQQPCDIVFVTDVRFPNEAEAIKDEGGVVVRVDRGDFILNQDAASHSTETALDDYQFDYTLDNTGNLDQLKDGVLEMLNKFLPTSVGIEN